ncbi:hypothetical protein ACVHNB_19685 [Streptomyces sp. YJ-C3]
MSGAKQGVHHIERVLAGITLIAALGFAFMLLFTDRQSFLTEVKAGTYAPELIVAAVAAAGWLLVRRRRHVRAALLQPSPRELALRSTTVPSRRPSGASSSGASGEGALAMAALLTASQFSAHGDSSHGADDLDHP